LIKTPIKTTTNLRDGYPAGFKAEIAPTG